MTTGVEPAVSERVNPCIRREIASIGALDAAIGAEKDPGYVVLFRSL